MMKKKGIFIVVICIVAISLIVCYLPFYIKSKAINDLENQGNYLVQRVEAYKKKNHKLPQYLEDMQLNLPDNYPLNYNTTKDSGIYVVSFQVGFFRSMVYYSDRKEWEFQK
ncbi:hypothetical protein ACPPVU_24295 [Mucilaginibacter sp. McL0603]|uniref:hypothetical protein n=1 Tax=Mucilaginibacter sp. McL0603 TaxID=3415670 RepID=UPI003CF618B1